VSLQLRAASGEVLCARIPAANVARSKKGARFRDPKHGVASAAGVDKLQLRVKKSDAAGLGVSGRGATLTVPPAGTAKVTLGLRDPATAEQGNHCAGAQVTLKAKKKGVSFP